MSFSSNRSGDYELCGVLIETAITSPHDRIQYGFFRVQWVTTGYLLATAIVVPITAYLTRNYTIRQLFLAANLLFIGGVLIICISPNLMIYYSDALCRGLEQGSHFR